MLTKEVFVILGGNNERAPNNIYYGVTFCEKTAKEAISKLGYCGGDGSYERALTITIENGSTVLLGKYGVIGSGDTTKVRTLNILKDNATRDEIKQYIEESKDTERLEKILASMTNSDYELLKKHMTK